MSLLNGYNGGEQARQVRRYATPGSPAAFGEAPLQQLLYAYQNRRPEELTGSRMRGDIELRTPDWANYGGYTIQPMAGSVYNAEGGLNQNPDLYAVYKTPAYGSKAEDMNGTPFDVVGSDGRFIGTHTWQGMDGEGGLEKFWNAAIPLLTTLFIGGGAAGAFGGGAAAAGEGAAAGSAGMGAAEGAGALTTGGGGFGAAGQVFGGNIAAGSGYGTAGLGSSLGGASGLGGAVGSGLGAGLGSAGSFAYPGLGSSLAGAGGSAATSASWMDRLGSLLKGSPTSAPGGGSGGGSAGGGSTGGGAIQSIQNIMNGTGTASDWLGLGATALGAISGAQGQSADQSSTRQLPAFLQGPVANGLVPQTQATMNAQLPGATLAGAQLLGRGSGLLGQTEPTTATNPYLASIADDMQRRTSQLLAENNVAIGGGATGMGARGGSRQGVAEGIAASRAADTLQGNLASLYGNAYNQDQSRLRQDWTLGSGFINQGLNTPFQPLQNTAQIYSPFTGFGTTSQNTSSGGGLQGAVGGAIAGASLGRQMGWW